MPSSKVRPRQPRRGSERVKAWIYHVINPLIEALQWERTSLENRNPTFRFFDGRLEYLRAPGRHLTADGQIVLRDLSTKHADLAARLDAHGARLEELRKAAVAAHDELLADAAFRGRVDGRVAEHLLHGGPEPWGAYGRDGFSKLVAERVVNQAPKELPSHFADATFWGKWAHEFRSLGGGERFTALTSIVRAISAEAKALGDDLEAFRTRLCDEHDVAAAPLPGDE